MDDIIHALPERWRTLALAVLALFTALQMLASAIVAVLPARYASHAFVRLLHRFGHMRFRDEPGTLKLPGAPVAAPSERPSRAPSAPSGQSGRATVATLVLLALVGVLGLAACPRAREAVLDTQSPRVACAADTQRCHDGAPEVCSRAGRWWPAMPPQDDGTRRRCADVCEVSPAGIAHCASSQVVTP